MISEDVGELQRLLLQINRVVEHQTDRLPWQKENDEVLARVMDMSKIKTRIHPLTCGNDSNHTPLYPYYDIEQNKIVLICRDCDYKQNNTGPY